MRAKRRADRRPPRSEARARIAPWAPFGLGDPDFAASGLRDHVPYRVDDQRGLLPMDRMPAACGNDEAGLTLRSRSAMKARVMNAENIELVLSYRVKTRRKCLDAAEQAFDLVATPAQFAVVRPAITTGLQWWRHRLEAQAPGQPGGSLPS